jgi:chromosome partitioning protein
MITVLVANPKGGCGKTTIATHLAAAFAGAGLRAALADADRQGSSLGWLRARPDGAASIQALDWHDGPDGLPEDVDRLVIDAPAAMKLKKVEALLRLADVVVVPVLPSGFDEPVTGAFLKDLEALKPVRKNRTAVAVLRNRVQTGTRTAAKLDRFMLGVGQTGVGRLRHRHGLPGHRRARAQHLRPGRQAERGPADRLGARCCATSRTPTRRCCGMPPARRSHTDASARAMATASRKGATRGPTSAGPSPGL